MNYIDYMKSGGIHIKEKNKGKFTESAKRAGKSVQEHATDVLNDPNATRLQKRRALFAKNAKKWKHEDGGVLFELKGGKALATGIKSTKVEDPELIIDEEKKENTTTGNSESATSQNADAYSWTKTKSRHYLQLSGGEQQTVTHDPKTGIYSQFGYSYSEGTSAPKGFRNNNWLNIRISDNNWQGKVPNNTDGEFELFETPELGIRAAAINIRTYGKRGLLTVKDIISTWAPSTENNTSSYILNVSSRMGVDPNLVLDLNDTDTMVKLISAMTVSENGKAGDEAVIRRGVEMA